MSWMEQVRAELADLVEPDDWTVVGDDHWPELRADVHDNPWDGCCFTWKVDETEIRLEVGDLELRFYHSDLFGVAARALVGAVEGFGAAWNAASQ